MKKLLVLLLIPFHANAYFQLDLMKAKKVDREATQWTLFDWMAQKNRVALMDHWLALNRSANWFELNAGATRGRLKLKSETGAITTTVNQDVQTYHLDMYLSILNIRGEYDKYGDEREAYGGALGLRLLGTSSQTTNLIARYGWRKTNNLVSQEVWENQYAEGNLQIYLVKAFGLNGAYRHYFPADSNKGTSLKGYRATAGAFLEFLIFRVYANAFQEPLERRASDGTVTKDDRSGIEGGVRLFF